MVRLDTNVMARYLAQDEFKQAALATHLMDWALVKE
jgi:predicted nucleic-acid-binding protein